MKKTVLIVVFLSSLLLFYGCIAKEQNDMGKNVTFINGVRDADVWILPKTEENLKTTVWGTATASKVKSEESRNTPLCEPGDGGLYLLRMIDDDGFFYSADGIMLEDGWTVRIQEDDEHCVTALVTDANGNVKKAYEVFTARL